MVPSTPVSTRLPLIRQLPDTAVTGHIAGQLAATTRVCVGVIPFPLLFRVAWPTGIR
jgi:hypothetical protein